MSALAWRIPLTGPARALALALGGVSGVALSQGCFGAGGDCGPGEELRPLDAVLEAYAFDEALADASDTGTVPTRVFQVRVELRPETVSLVFEDGDARAVATYRRPENSDPGAHEFVDPYLTGW